MIILLFLVKTENVWLWKGLNVANQGRREYNPTKRSNKSLFSNIYIASCTKIPITQMIKTSSFGLNIGIQYLNDTNLFRIRFMNLAYLWIRGWWRAYDLDLCWLLVSYLGSPIPNGVIEWSGIPDTGRLLKCLCSLSWFLDSVAWKTWALLKSGVAWPSKPVECRWNEVLSAPELEVEGTCTGWRKPRRARYGQTSELLAALEWSPIVWSS